MKAPTRLGAAGVLWELLSLCWNMLYEHCHVCSRELNLGRAHARRVASYFPWFRSVCALFHLRKGIQCSWCRDYPSFRHFLHLGRDSVFVFYSSGCVPISEQAEDSLRAECTRHDSSAPNASHKETEAQLGSQSSLGSEPGPKSQWPRSWPSALLVVRTCSAVKWNPSPQVAAIRHPDWLGPNAHLLGHDSKCFCFRRQY